MKFSFYIPSTNALRQLLDLDSVKVSLPKEAGKEGSTKGQPSSLRPIYLTSEAPCLICTRRQVNNQVASFSEDHESLLTSLLGSSEQEDDIFIGLTFCPVCLSAVRKLLRLTEEVEDIKARIKVVMKLSRPPSSRHPLDDAESNAGEVEPCSSTMKMGGRERAGNLADIVDDSLLEPPDFDLYFPMEVDSICSDQKEESEILLYGGGLNDQKKFGPIVTKSNSGRSRSEEYHGTSSATGGQGHSCYFCQKTCPSYSSLEQHLRLHTLEGDSRPIHSCHGSNDDPKNMNKSSPQTGLHHCSDCQQSFKDDRGFRAHMRSEHLEKSKMHGTPDKTEKVNVDAERWDGSNYVDTSRKLKTAYTRKRREKYQCHLCHKVLKDRHTLSKHTRAIHQAKKVHLPLSSLQERGRSDYTCPDCGKRFVGKALITLHMQRIHLLYPRESDVFPNYIHCFHDRTTPSLATCYFCQEVMSSPAAFCDHLKIHTKERMPSAWDINAHVGSFECLICDKLFKNRHNLQKHTRAVHQAKKVYLPLQSLREQGCSDYTCPECQKRFHKKSLILHMQRIHLLYARESDAFPKYTNENWKAQADQNTINAMKVEDSCVTPPQEEFPDQQRRVIPKLSLPPCYFCRKVLSTPTELWSHLKIHTKERLLSTRYTSPQCGKRSEEQRVTRHVHQRDRKRCPICRRTYGNRAVYRAHTHPDPKDTATVVYNCSHCPVITKTRVQFNIHIHNHHQVASRRICYFCNNILSSSTSLQAHMTRHTNERPFACTYCGRRFKFHYQLQNHKCRRPTTNADNCSFQCHLCGKAYRDRGSWRFHMAGHEARRAELPKRYQNGYSCPECGKVFEKKKGVRTHMQFVHHLDASQKKGVCSICNKYFLSEQVFQAHTHLDPINDPATVVYNCPTCGKACRNPQYFLTHMNEAHKSVRVCDKCGNVYTANSSLVRHMKTCTSKRPAVSNFKCYFCGKSFDGHFRLKEHLRDHTLERLS